MKQDSEEFREHLRNIGFKKGNKPLGGRKFWKGHKINLGRKRPPMTKQQKLKLSEAHKGKIPYNKGWKTKQREFICVNCQEVFWVHLSKIKQQPKILSCSPQCKGVGMRQEKNPFWKGGITPLRVRISQLPQYIIWRKQIFERDNFTCQHCNQFGGELQVHHVKPLSKIIHEHHIKTVIDALNCSELWDLNNGLTLCLDCHKQTDTYLNRGIING